MQAEGIRRERRSPGAGRTGQHAFAAGVVDVVFLPAIAGAGLHQLVERIVGKRLAHAVNPPTTGVSPRSPHKNAQAAAQPAALKVYRHMGILTACVIQPHQQLLSRATLS